MKTGDFLYNSEIESECGLLRLQYWLTENAEGCGIRIRECSAGIEAAAPAISPDRAAVERIVRMLWEASVTPVTLLDIIEDLLP